jgi:hypothetical protein
MRTTRVPRMLMRPLVSSGPAKATASSVQVGALFQTL